MNSVSESEMLDPSPPSMKIRLSLNSGSRSSPADAPTKNPATLNAKLSPKGIGFPYCTNEDSSNSLSVV